MGKILIFFASNFSFIILLFFATFRTPIFSPSPYGNFPSQLWESVRDPRKFKVLQFDSEIKMINPIELKKRVKFWQDLNLSDAKSWVPL